jgi:isoquinoline 1-oxidoreductase beta subunit
MAEDGADPVTLQGLHADGDHALSYRVPHLPVERATRGPPVPPGFWRGVNINQNAAYLECFLDELAHAAGKDPLELRRKLMADHPDRTVTSLELPRSVAWHKSLAASVVRVMLSGPDIKD